MAEVGDGDEEALTEESSPRLREGEARAGASMEAVTAADPTDASTLGVLAVGVNAPTSMEVGEGRASWRVVERASAGRTRLVVVWPPRWL